MDYYCYREFPWLQSVGSLRVGHDSGSSLSLFTSMHWRRKWQPTPVFLPGESQGRGAWWAAVSGVAQSWTRRKRLSSSSSSSSSREGNCWRHLSPSLDLLEDWGLRTRHGSLHPTEQTESAGSVTSHDVASLPYSLQSPEWRWGLRPVSFFPKQVFWISSPSLVWLSFLQCIQKSR